MKGNGALPDDKGFNRFLAAMEATKALDRREEASQRVSKTADEERADLLSGWASQSPCKTYFIPFLEEEYEKADATASASISDHAAVAYNLGRKDALKQLLYAFKSWAGTVNYAAKGDY